MEIKTRYYVCNCFFDILTFIKSKNQKRISKLTKICEKSKQLLKFHTTFFEDETLCFQLSDEFGVSCLRCVYSIQKDKGYQKKNMSGIFWIIAVLRLLVQDFSRIVSINWLICLITIMIKTLIFGLLVSATWIIFMWCIC